MSHPRPGRWDLVGHDRDPVPVDELDVQHLARGYAATAHDITVLAKRLDNLSRLQGWKGKAAETFADKAEDGAHELRKAQKRYDDLAVALKEWVHPVREARDRTADALHRAEEAEHLRTQNLHDLTAGHADPPPELVDAEERRRQRHDAAVAAITRAAHAVRDALDDLDDAARRTAHAISQAAKSYKDGFGATFKGFVRDYAGAIKTVCDVLGKVAIVLGAITLAFALLSTAPAWLLVAGFAVAVAMLVGHTALLVSDTGEATWLDVGLDLLAVATAGFGLRMTPVAKALAGEARTVVTAEQGEEAARQVLRQAAQHPDAARAAAASRISDPTNNLFRWQAARAARIAQEASAAKSQAIQALKDELETMTPSLRQVLVNVDRENATLVAEMERLRELSTHTLVPKVLDRLRDLRIAAQVGFVGSVHDVVKDRIDRVEKLEKAFAQDVSNQVHRWTWRLTTASR